MRLFLVIILCAGLFLAGTLSAELYKYVDEKGQVHFTDNPYSVPEKYRNSLEQVKKEISQESEVKHPQKLPPDWRSWVVSDSRGNFGINLRAMFLYCLRESRLIFWLAGEFILLVIFIILLVISRNWPTRKGRVIWRISSLLGWIILSLGIFIFLLSPSLEKFLALSRGHLSEIIQKAPLDENSVKTLKELEQKLEEIQSRLL